MDLPVDIETTSFSLQSFQSRYIVTQVGPQKIGFPSQWVAEIMLVERSQILKLPFYNSRLLGVVHHQGSIIPLVTLQLTNSVISIGFSNITFHTPPAPLNKGGAVREDVSNSNPIGISQSRVNQRLRNQETLTAIRLNPSVSTLPSVGLIVDRVIGSISHEQLLANEQQAKGTSHLQIEVFQPERIPPSIWQPQ